MQALSQNFGFSHPEGTFADNGRMKKEAIRQILALNLRAAMERTKVLDTQASLAIKAGISQSHLSEIMRGMCSVTVDLVVDLAQALGVEPWELLADSESTRRAAMAKMIWGETVSNEEVERHLPPAPRRKEPAMRRRRKRGDGHGNRGGEAN